jgi:hypothetical protein
MPRQRLLRLLPTDHFLAAAVGAAVELPKGAEGETGKLTWIMSAYEGEFRGYRFPMKLTRATFDSFVKNLRRDPQFKAGTDGYGAQPVVRMDYEHASAMPPYEGSIPSSGVPAPGWICDAEVRVGKGGRSEFWTLCQLGDQLREQIQANEMRFVSIDAPLKNKDPVTGEDIGPKLDALAVTNSPFLRDLEPMRVAASMSVSQYGKAETGDELLVGLRQILEADDEAAPADLAKLVQDLGAAFETDMRPPGYPEGLGCVIACLRQLLGMPMLSTADAIIEAAGQQLAALSASTTSTPLPPVTTTPEEPMAATTTTMSDKLRGSLIQLYGCVDHDDAILAAATKASGASAILDDMMKTYGAKDPKDLADKAGAARDAAGKAAEFGAKMAELLATLDGNAQEEQAQETEAVAASIGFAKKDDPRGITARSIIMTEGLAARRAALGIELEADGKTLKLGAKDDSKFKAYRVSYPLPNAEQRKAVLLTTPITAGTGGAQFGGRHTELTQSVTTSTNQPEHIAVLSAYSGANDIERAIAYLSDKQAGFAKLDWHRQNFLADQYLRTGKAA